MKHSFIHKRFLVAVLVVLGVVFGRNHPIFAESPTAIQGNTYIVDSEADDATAICAPLAGNCTLRAAILAANANPGADGIWIQGDEITITLDSRLPDITDPVAIFALAAQTVRIDASGVSFPIKIEADDVEISNLLIYGNVASATLITVDGSVENLRLRDNTIGYKYDWPNTDCQGGFMGGFSGIEIAADDVSDPPSGTRAWIYGNIFRCLGIDAIMIRGSNVVIGQDPNGNQGTGQRNIITDLGGIQVGGQPGGTGIVLASGSDNNLIVNNEITGNDSHGIHLFDSDSNIIQDNELVYNLNGIMLESGSNYNTIGCDLSFPIDSSEGNAIYENIIDGIRLTGSNTSHNWMTCNEIGLGEFSTWDDGNGRAGIGLFYDTHDNTIGGANGGRNIIGDSDSHGIWIYDSHANDVIGNYIGTDVDGATVKANKGSGIKVEAGSADNVIGGDTRYHANLISGNEEHGILITGALGGNKIECNQIGIKATSDSYEALPNQLNGITVRDTNAFTIGSTCDGGSTFSRNLLIAHNGGAGIVVDGAADGYIGAKTYVALNDGAGIMISDTVDTLVRPNYVVGNGGAGIGMAGNTSVLASPTFAGFGNGGLLLDLGMDGPDGWDAGDGDTGPNTRLNYPLVNTTVGWTVSGTACQRCNVFIYEGFGTTPAGNGGGGIYLGFVSADRSGNWTADLSQWAGSGGGQLDAPSEAVYMAFDTVLGNSSELSAFGGVPTVIQLLAADAAAQKTLLSAWLLLLGCSSCWVVFGRKYR